MNKEKEIKKDINGCPVTLCFKQNADKKLKDEVLWLLTRCYEDRVVGSAKN